MGGDEEYYTSDRLYKKPNLPPRHQGDLNLQLCFMNDAATIPNNSDSSGSDQESGIKHQKPHLSSTPNLSEVMKCLLFI